MMKVRPLVLLVVTIRTTSLSLLTNPLIENLIKVDFPHLFHIFVHDTADTANKTEFTGWWNRDTTEMGRLVFCGSKPGCNEYGNDPPVTTTTRSLEQGLINFLQPTQR